MIRPPAVAGRFYPGNSEELLEAVREYAAPAVAPPKLKVVGAVIPHAGYMYSGHVAGAVYSRMQVSSRTIILCPNHTGLGPPLSITRSGSWATPLGKMEIDERISSGLMAADAQLQDDVTAHRYEHAIEVQLPFIQSIAGSGAQFVPITVGTSSWNDLEALGNAIARIVHTEADIAIIASSDMNHYESDVVTRVKDRKAIGRILQLDARGLYDVVRGERISMCGFGPTTAMLIAAKHLGASRAELVKYATSGDVSGDFDRVVGYAGIVVM
jgi:AmmeMemoRadiSam system protein B